LFDVVLIPPVPNSSFKDNATVAVTARKATCSRFFHIRSGHLALLGSTALVFALCSPAAFAQAPAARAQSPRPAVVALRGVVTALKGEVALPGATLRLEPNTEPPAAADAAMLGVSDERGRFQFVGVAPGRYRVTASLSGFVDATQQVTLQLGVDLDVTIDLQIEGVSETVVVVPQVTLEVGASLGSAALIDVAQMQTVQASDVSIEAILPLVPGVIHGPSGVSIKGGRPTQSSVQMGNVDLTDASTGEAEFRFPSGAVGSLEVLPSPYAVEYGRFSAGLTVLQTRKGGDKWKFSLAGINPAFRTKREHPTTLIGVESFSPRVTFSGPLVKDRVFVAQSLQYRYASNDIWSRPQSERTKTEGFGSFTRVDSKLKPGQNLSVTLGVFPERRTYATLATFDPPEETASIRRRLVDVAITEEASLAPGTFVESTVQIKRHDADVYGRGQLDMEWLPQGRTGNFFNDQSRNTWGIQWHETVSGVRQKLAGTHFYKAGVDLTHASFDETNTTRPVNLRRADGTLARRIVFSGGDSLDGAGTDVALFIQDRWQPIGRVLVDAGIRMDRDGVLESSTFSPRLGVRFSLDSKDRMTLGAGVGRFVERTPLTIGAVAGFETRTVTDYAADGATATRSVTYAPRLGTEGLEAPRALTWHAEYDYRISQALSFRADVLTRDTTHEYVVLPEEENGASWLTIDSRGRSRYREIALGARYSLGPRLVTDVSYVRASGKADLNNYALYFGTIRTPILRDNVYARSESEVPNRVLAQVRSDFRKWRASSVFEYRDGLPFSAVNALQEYVGTPNEAGRLRSVMSLEVTAERRLKIGKVKPWLGLQLINGLGRFNPRDVQTNVTASDYGTFYNSDPRRVRITLRF
jgi:hypothetical protein